MTDYFDRIERQLVVSTERIYGQAYRTSGRSVHHRFRGRLALVSAAATAAVAAAAAAVIALTQPIHSNATRISPHRTVVDAYLPRGLEANFAAFRRGQQPGDVLPSPMLHTLPSGVNPNLSRLLLSSTSIAIWFVPGPSDECIAEAANLPNTGAAIATYSAACSPLKQTELDGILDLGPAGGTQLIAGVAPDGVKSVNVLLENGGSTTLTPNADGAFAQYLPSPATEIVYHDANGSSQTVHPAKPNSGPTPPNPCPANSSWCR